MTRTGLLVLLLAAPCVLPAAEPAPPTLTPGPVALLLEAVADPATAPQIAAALGHSDPQVRGAAARVAHVAALRSLQPDLLAVLATETDRGAALEEIRAAFTAGAGLDQVTASAERLRLVEPMVIAYARTHGPASDSVLPTVLALKEPPLASFVEQATRRGRDGLGRFAAPALRDANAPLWRAVLSAAPASGTSALPTSLLVAGLSSPGAPLRVATAWYVLSSESRPPSLPPIDAMAGPGTNAAEIELEQAFVFALLRRAYEGNVGRDWATELRGAGADEWRGRLGEPAVARLLTRAEARAASAAITNGDDEEMLTKLALLPVKPLPAGDRTPMHLLPPLPAGLARDVLAVTGCEPRDDEAAAAAVLYHPDGRPKSVTMIDAARSAGCERAVRNLMSLGLTSATTETATQVVLAWLGPDDLACTDVGTPETPRRVGRSSGRSRPVEEPKKVRDVKPIYPAEAKSKGSQGMVLTEAVIGPNGCIRELDVISSPDRLLSQAAILSVSRWRYTPTLLEGVAVPVLMTITVNFKISH